MHAVFVEVDNSGEDPQEGVRGLREELAPAVQQLPGFGSAIFLTAHERGSGVGVVTFSSHEQADQFARGFPPGASIRPGVTVLRSELFEVAATA
jgi:hypothetical protein